MNVSFLAYRATLINVEHSKHKMGAKWQLVFLIFLDSSALTDASALAQAHLAQHC